MFLAKDAKERMSAKTPSGDFACLVVIAGLSKSRLASPPERDFRGKTSFDHRGAPVRETRKI